MDLSLVNCVQFESLQICLFGEPKIVSECFLHISRSHNYLHEDFLSRFFLKLSSAIFEFSKKNVLHGAQAPFKVSGNMNHYTHRRKCSKQASANSHFSRGSP
jgi:hypothetical protein